MKNIKIKKILTLTILLFTYIFASGQKGHDTFKIKLGNPQTDKLFVQKVTIYDIENNKIVTLKDGNYTLNSNEQQADISIKNGIINGLVFVVKDQNKKEVNTYKIKNSMVQEFTVYVDGILTQSGKREAEKAYYKEYYPDGKQTLKTESWMSLDKNKYYGRGISKRYYESGTLSNISDRITETYTEFYPNGNKKEINGLNIHETYTESGNLHNKQYTKNNIRYNDYFSNGKLITHSYQDGERNEVTEYYQNGVFQKKEIEKMHNGEKRVFTYDKADKLVSNEPPFSGVSKVKVNNNEK